MNIFEDMKVFIKPLGVVSPVSEINVNNDTVFTSYGIYNIKHVVCMFKTGLKDKNNKDIYVGDNLIDGSDVYEVDFNSTKGFTLINKSRPNSELHFLTEDRFMQLAASNLEVINNKYYIKMHEKSK